jgi:hypothetical protein
VAATTKAYCLLSDFKWILIYEAAHLLQQNKIYIYIDIMRCERSLNWFFSDFDEVFFLFRALHRDY